MSYLFDYHIKQIDNNYNTVGFSKSSINKVIKNLEDKNISYMIINRSDNYEVEVEEDFKSNNKYQELYVMAHKNVTLKSKINCIHNYLLDIINM